MFRLGTANGPAPSAPDPSRSPRTETLRHNRRKTRLLRAALERLDLRVLLTGVPTSWVPRGSGGGGALFSPSISPTNPAEEYISSDMGQVFHTTDAGASWREIDFRQLQGGHESQVQATEVPGLLYSVDYGNNASVVKKSTDGGTTWNPLPADPTGGGVFRLFADPANHNRLLVTDYTHLYASADGGATWNLRYTTPHSGAGLHTPGVFFDGSNIYAGTSDGLLVSANGGATFSASTAGGIAAGQVILAFAGSKQGATTRFVAVTRAVGDVYAGIQGYDYTYPDTVYTLDVGQPSWAARMTGIATPAYLNFAGMSANDVNDAYLAGGGTAGAPTVYKTTDGGLHWVSVFQTANNQNVATGWSGQGGDRQWSYGEVALGLAVAANDPNHLVFTDLGFAHESADGGATWHALYVKPADLNPAGSATPKGRSYHDSGLDNTTSWGVNWVDQNRLIVSNSDIYGQVSSDGGQSFGFGFTGNTYNSTYRTVTAASGVVYAATSSVHDMYQSTHLTDASIDGGNGAVLFSADKGATWQTLHNFGKPVVWVATDPTNPNRLFASVVNSSVGGVYVTNNVQAGASSVWTKLTVPTRGGQAAVHPFGVQVLNDGTIVATFSGRRAGSPVNFTNTSGVFVSTDKGATWVDRTGAGLAYWTNDLTVDPGDPTQNTWYAGVYSGWGGAANNLGGLYKTADRGQHWSLVKAFTGVTSTTFNPANSNELWVTTEDQGLWYSANAQTGSPTLTQVASYTFRQPERVFYNPYNPSEIWVTSFGSGLMVGNTASAGPAGSLQFSSGSLVVREDAGTASITVSRTGGSTGAVSVHYATSDGTATAGTDYTTTSGTLVFADGQTTATFTVPILNDLTPDGSETLNLTLSAAAGGATLGAQSTAVLVINDVARVWGDFDGDGKTDRGVFRVATSQWFVNQSSAGPISPVPVFGAPGLGDIPVVGDFDGVGHPEMAVFRPSTSEWFVLGPAGGHLLGTFGAPNLFDIPVPGDYDGVGHAQMAVFRPSTSEWYVMGAAGGHLLGRFGAPNLFDVPVPGDYDGMGHTEMAVFRPSTSEWYVSGPGGGRLLGTFGAPNLSDVPAPGDYDGVGHTEMAVFRPSTSEWFAIGPAGGHLLGAFGGPKLADVPYAGPVAALKRLKSLSLKAAGAPHAGSAAVGPAGVAGPVFLGVPQGPLARRTKAADTSAADWLSSSGGRSQGDRG